MNHKLGKYIEILRPASCLMGSFSVLLGIIIAIKQINLMFFIENPHNIIKVLLAMIIYFLVVGSGNTINDVIDLDIDKINRPRRTMACSFLLYLFDINYWVDHNLWSFLNS